MPTVAENLKRLLESEPGMNPTRLARETGVSQPTIWKVLNGKIVDPGTEILEPLAKRFGKAVAQLRGELPLEVGVAEAVGRYVTVPHYNAVGGLGAGRINEHHIELSGSYPLPEDLVVSNGWRAAALFVVDTQGPSMEPTIHDGDPVVVNGDEKRIVSGKIYAIEDPDEGLRIKRLIRELDGRVRVVSDNPNKMLYPDSYLTPDIQARIVGRVVHRSGQL